MAFDSAMVSKAVVNFPLSHIDSLAWGSLVACISHETFPRSLKNLRTWFASSIIATVTVGLLWAYHLERNMLPPSWKSLGFDYGMRYGYQYVWGWSIIGFCCFLLILEVIHDPAFARLFQQRPLIFLGKISFGFYIWHLPILSMVSGVWNPSPHSLPGLAKTFLVFALSLIAGSLVHSIIEKRFGRWLSENLGCLRRRNNVPAI
jgi:peptidoglycan/LPS O-acetylase OafA/YrhL